MVSLLAVNIHLADILVWSVSWAIVSDYCTDVEPHAILWCPGWPLLQAKLENTPSHHNVET